ncbi:MAG: NUDIX hydrolase [Bacteroidales bacterium]|nr:NUDIX hydrolase [Bacteroidales bacterium]
MEKNKYCYDYPRPALTTDCVIFGYDDAGENPKVLLVERKNDPYKGYWAFPGGFMEMYETTEECAKRELYEETGLSEIPVFQLYTFSGVDRDPRGRVISVVYYAKVKITECDPVAGDDASQTKWFGLNELPKLAFDHQMILQVAIDKIMPHNS